ncbi:MAG: Coq4 family protein [Actinomycetota bacterium]
MQDLKEPIVDRDFAEKFLTAVDRPFDYGVYLLFHDWWAEAPQDAINAYHHGLLAVDGASDCLAERHLPEPTTLDELADCAPGTLGDGYRRFIVDNDLEANLARNYRQFNEQLTANGTLDRLPDDISYMIVRGFQLHDMMHTLTGFSPSPLGELAQAGYHFAQLQFPYHAFRFAVTTAHLAFVNPGAIEQAMDAMVTGWMVGRFAQNTHFMKLEDELHTPLDELRGRIGIDPTSYRAF